jgi:hypothetical protein
MHTARMAFAKTSRPDVSRMIRRPRVERLLGRRGAARTTWIWGPPGAGKTTAIATFLAARRLRTLWYQVDASDDDVATLFYYLGRAATPARPLPVLTPESRAALSTFSRQYFRKLYVRFRGPLAVVFDNFHELSPDSAVHEVLRTAIAEMPPRARMFVISRTPPVESRYEVGEWDVVDWRHLRVTAAEARRLAALRSRSRRPLAEVRRLHEFTGGWMAGLVLLLRYEHSNVRGLPQDIPEVLFEYFADEIFDRASGGTQQILLATAFLPPFHARTAVDLTGDPAAADIADSFERAGYFTTRGAGADGRYQYHRLYRQFLQTRARATWPDAHLARVLRQAASLAEREGDVEPAADLLRQAGDWTLLSDLIERNAPRLMAQGRIETLAGWIAGVPEPVVSMRPWLLCWRGLSQMGRDDERCRRDSEAALVAFRSGGDLNGALLSWSTVVTSLLMQGRVAPLDLWITMLDEVLRELPGEPDPHIDGRVATAMLLAIVYRRPNHPERQRWAEKALEAAARAPDPLLRGVAAFGWVLYAWMFGATGRAARVLDSKLEPGRGPDVSPLVALYGGLAQAWHEHFGAAPTWKETLASLLALADDSGLRGHPIIASILTCGAFTAFSDDDVETARAWMIELGELLARLDSAFVVAHYGLQMRDALEPDSKFRTVAFQYIERRQHVADHSLGRVFGHACAAYLHSARGDHAAAATEARESLNTAEEAAAPYFRWVALLTTSHVCYSAGDDAAGARALRTAMELGREHGYVNSHVWVPRIMAALCARALDAGIEDEYVRDLIRLRRLVCPPGASTDAWPWRVKVYTTPRLSVHVGGTPLAWKGRVPRQSLSLLESLIRCGPRGTEDSSLMDRLWPDAEGDTAAGALATAVFRLKRLLDTDESIVRSGGRTRLNSAVCWVDVWH